MRSPVVLVAAASSWHLDLAALGLVGGLVVAAAGRTRAGRAPSLIIAPLALAAVLGGARFGAGPPGPPWFGGAALVGAAAAAGAALGALAARRAAGSGPDAATGAEATPAAVARAEGALDDLLIALVVADLVIWLGVPDTEGAVLAGAALAPLALDAVAGRAGWRPAALGAPRPATSPGAVIALAAAAGAWTALVAFAILGGTAALPPGGTAVRAVVVPWAALLAAVVVAGGRLVTSGRARPPR